MVAMTTPGLEHAKPRCAHRITIWGRAAARLPDLLVDQQPRDAARSRRAGHRVQRPRSLENREGVGAPLEQEFGGGVEAFGIMGGN